MDPVELRHKHDYPIFVLLKFLFAKTVTEETVLIVSQVTRVLQIYLYILYGNTSSGCPTRRDSFYSLPFSPGSLGPRKLLLKNLQKRVLLQPKLTRDHHPSQVTVVKEGVLRVRLPSLPFWVRKRTCGSRLNVSSCVCVCVWGPDPHLHLLVESDSSFYYYLYSSTSEDTFDLFPNSPTSQGISLGIWRVPTRVKEERYYHQRF